MTGYTFEMNSTDTDRSFLKYSHGHRNQDKKCSESPKDGFLTDGASHSHTEGEGGWETVTSASLLRVDYAKKTNLCLICFDCFFVQTVKGCLTPFLSLVICLLSLRWCLSIQFSRRRRRHCSFAYGGCETRLFIFRDNRLIIDARVCFLNSFRHACDARLNSEEKRESTWKNNSKSFRSLLVVNQMVIEWW